MVSSDNPAGRLHWLLTELRNRAAKGQCQTWQGWSDVLGAGNTRGVVRAIRLGLTPLPLEVGNHIRQLDTISDADAFTSELRQVAAMLGDIGSFGAPLTQVIHQVSDAALTQLASASSLISGSFQAVPQLSDEQLSSIRGSIADLMQDVESADGLDEELREFD